MEQALPLVLVALALRPQVDHRAKAVRVDQLVDHGRAGICGGVPPRSLPLGRGIKEDLTKDGRTVTLVTAPTKQSIFRAKRWRPSDEVQSEPNLHVACITNPRGSSHSNNTSRTTLCRQHFVDLWTTVPVTVCRAVGTMVSIHTLARAAVATEELVTQYGGWSKA
eukprot:scaffold90127_cov63-Phaeocystis_antarctica.AAC.10